MKGFDYDAPENRFLVQFHADDCPPGVAKWGGGHLARSSTQEAAVERFCRLEKQYVGHQYEVLCWDANRRQYSFIKTGYVKPT